jgi:SAM-dependent methyltransferase
MLKMAEQNHFWFRVRRNWILDFIRKFKASQAKVLEIGCGAGNVSSFLAENNYHVVGCEYYKEALDMAWPGFRKVQCSASDLPFPDNSFDVVGLFDVIEHFEDEIPLLTEAKRVLNPDGIIIIAVPARQELWSAVDDISFHRHRYSRKSMDSLLQKSGFTPVSIQYIFMSLYLPMKLLRTREAGSGDSLKISGALNSIAGIIFNIERILTRFIRLPIGTSIIAVAKK